MGLCLKRAGFRSISCIQTLDCRTLFNTKKIVFKKRVTRMLIVPPTAKRQMKIILMDVYVVVTKVIQEMIALFKVTMFE